MIDTEKIRCDWRILNLLDASEKEKIQYIIEVCKQIVKADSKTVVVASVILNRKS